MRTNDVPRSELTPGELARAAQENVFALFRSMTALPGAELEELPSLSRHHAPPSNPMFKSVWNCRFGPDEVDDAIGDSLAWFRARAAPFVFWWLGPGTDPPGLRAALEAGGWDVFERDAPTMAAELDALDWGALERVPDGFAIERVRTDDQLEAWARTFVAAFDVPEFAGAAWVEATRTLGIDGAPWTIYLGVLDGEPVATNILTPGAGVAQVFGVGTLAAARRKGIGAAITLAAYRDARELGYRYGVLFSTELGRSVYRRLGFAECGTGITRYLWVRS